MTPESFAEFVARLLLLLDEYLPADPGAEFWRHMERVARQRCVP